MSDRDLPEGVINAEPAGGWESGASADAATAERSSAEAGSPELSDAGSSAHEGRPEDGSVEGTGPDVDPDLSAPEEE
jgi:hypothetical protein